MRMRNVLAFTAVVVAVAVGLATAGSTAVSNTEPQRGRPAEPPQGRPPGGPGGGPQGMGIERQLFDLNLTAAQREQVRALMDARREAGATLQEQLRDLGDQMRALVEADSFDDEAARALAAKETTATAELRVIGARTDAAIYRLLTAEQKTTLSKLRTAGPGPRGGERR